MPEDYRLDHSWHLDKRVPIALIGVALAQLVGLVWWAATLSSLVTAHDGRIARLEIVDDRLGGIQGVMIERLARLEALQAAQVELLRRIEAKVTP